MMPLAPRLLIGFLLFIASLQALPPDGAVFPLWPEGRANLKKAITEIRSDRGHISQVSEPTLTYYAPAVDRPTGTAVVIAPGGGYSNLSAEREGVQYARWLGTLGITSFVLKYRLKEYGHPAPLQDIAQAVRIVRSRAEEFRLRTDRIGAMGSSAGGHLAASVATLFAHADALGGTALDSVSARPDFIVLMYPVITFTEDSAHSGSRKSLLGDTPSPELVRLLSVEKQVTATTPPTLLIHTQEDKTVSVENSILFYQALTRAGVPAEMHLFQRGPHGIGMRPGLGTTSDWPTLAEGFLRARGLLDPVPKP